MRLILVALAAYVATCASGAPTWWSSGSRSVNSDRRQAIPKPASPEPNLEDIHIPVSTTEDEQLELPYKLLTPDYVPKKIEAFRNVLKNRNSSASQQQKAVQALKLYRGIETERTAERKKFVELHSGKVWPDKLALEAKEMIIPFSTPDDENLGMPEELLTPEIVVKRVANLRAKIQWMRYRWSDDADDTRRRLNQLRLLKEHEGYEQYRAQKREEWKQELRDDPYHPVRMVKFAQMQLGHQV